MTLLTIKFQKMLANQGLHYYHYKRMRYYSFTFWWFGVDFCFGDEWLDD